MNTAVAERKPSLVAKMAGKYGVDPDKMLVTLKATAFKTQDGTDVTNEQMMALLVVADQYGLNPWLNEIYAFPDKKNRIVPIVGIDGWSRIINGNEQLDGLEFRESEKIIESPDHKPCPEWIECIVYRKDREHPTIVREYLDEVYRPPFIGKKGQPGEYTISGPWQSHTKRMLRHKSLIQCSRIAFGYVGIYDEDEGARIIEGGATVINEEPKDRTDPRDMLSKSAQAKLPTEDVGDVFPSLSFELLKSKFENATDPDILDADATLIAEIEDPDQRDQLADIYKACREKLGG